MSERADWDREYRWARLEATGMVTCPQCGHPFIITKQLNTPYRTSSLLKFDNGEEIIDAPYCHCRKRSEEDRALIRANNLFTAALKQCGLTYVALAGDVRGQSGIVGYVVAQNILTPEQIDTVEQAFKHALQTQKGSTTMTTDGNSQTDGQPTQAASTSHIMDPLSPGNFGVMETTTDVVGGMGNVKMVSLPTPEGSAIFAEHHQIGILPMPAPTQDVPPGEQGAKP